MTLTEKPENQFSTDELAEALKALGHPSRLEIIRQLAMRDRCCGGDFCDCMPLAQSTISQHLDMLKKVGIIQWQQQGTRSIYTLNNQRLLEIGQAMTQIANTSICTNSQRD